MSGRRQNIVLIVVLIIAVFVPLRVLWEVRNNVLNEIEVVQTEQAASRSRVQQANQAERLRNDYLDILEDLQGALPSTARLEVILEDLTVAADQSGALVVSVTPRVPSSAAAAPGAAAPAAGAAPGGGEPGVPEPTGVTPESVNAAGLVAPPPGATTGGVNVVGNRRLGVTVTVAGSPDALVSFMAQLRQRDRLYVVDVRSFSWAETEGAGVLVSATMDIAAFMWSPSYQAPAGGDTGQSPATTTTTTAPTEILPDDVVVTGVVFGDPCPDVADTRGLTADGAQARCRAGAQGLVWVEESW